MLIRLPVKLPENDCASMSGRNPGLALSETDISNIDPVRFTEPNRRVNGSTTICKRMKLPETWMMGTEPDTACIANIVPFCSVSKSPVIFHALDTSTCGPNNVTEAFATHTPAMHTDSGVGAAPIQVNVEVGALRGVLVVAEVLVVRVGVVETGSSV